MARKRKNSLSTLKKYADFLLFEATAGTLGTRPPTISGNISTDATFAEKRGLLDTLLKIAALEQKDASDNPEESGLDLIRKQMAKDKENDSRDSRGSRDTGRTTEDSTNDSDSDSDNFPEDNTAG